LQPNSFRYFRVLSFKTQGFPDGVGTDSVAISWLDMMMTHIPYQRIRQVAEAGARAESRHSQEQVFSPEECAHLEDCADCVETFAEIVRDLIGGQRGAAD
jgi:hypothetical protein